MISTLNINEILISKLILLPGLLITITLHELAHGMSAYLLGDPTAKKSWKAFFKSYNSYRFSWFSTIIYCWVWLG